MMDHLPKRQRMLVIGAGAAVLLLILNTIVFTPLGNLWQSHSDEIDQLEAEVAKGRLVRARGPITRREWSDLQHAALPMDQAESEHQLLAAFDGWGRESGVEVSSIRPQWKHDSENTYSMLECRLDATGSLSSLSRFLYDIEKLPMAMQVESAEFISEDDTGDRIKVSLTITGLRLAPQEGKS